MVEQFFALNLQGLIQTLLMVGTVFVGVGAMRNEIRTHATHLEKLENKIDKLETAFVQLARQDERIAAMDSRLLAQGRRLDRVQYGFQTQEGPAD